VRSPVFMRAFGREERCSVESLRPPFGTVYRRIVAALTMMRRGACVMLVVPLPGCTSIDPGPDFQSPDTVFDADYFYCHVEPELIFEKKCGSGDPSKGDQSNGCHFNSSVVTGMALIDHPAVDCGGGDHPVDSTQIGTGSPAQGNYAAASLEMTHQYITAPIFVRPSGNNHPRQIFDPTDPQVNQLLATWAR
jgi:hypothetical protein